LYRANVAHFRELITRETVNLQLVGRNGLHKYNNQDHAMMTGLLAARNVTGGSYDLWRVNSDAEYLEDESTEDVGSRLVPFPAATKSYHQPKNTRRLPLSLSDDES
jgi:hypothetical protein